MKEVARAAGVHQTTVSLALRNDPRLPAETRTRIRTIAERIGYRPDPMLAALSQYRLGRREVKAPTHMAFLLNFHDRAEMEASYPHRLFLEGAQRQAEQMGYQLDPLYVGHRVSGAGQRTERVLQARGIIGVILAAFGDRMIRFQMDWERFCVVRIESHQLARSLHMVSSHQMEITREAVLRLHLMGYNRIGLAIGECEETYLHNAFTAGYYVEAAQHPAMVHLPPLLFPVGAGVPEIASPLVAWSRAHGIEVIISNWHEVPAALRLAGWRLPDDIVVASLDVEPGRGVNAGMRQNHRIVGERAVEQLAILLRTNQRGLGRPHNSTLIEGEWVDGSDVPPRQAFISKHKIDRRGL